MHVHRYIHDIYMYIHIDIHICMYEYIYIYTHMYVYMFTYVRIRIRTRIRTRIRVGLGLALWLYVCVKVNVFAYVYAYVYLCASFFVPESRPRFLTCSCELPPRDSPNTLHETPQDHSLEPESANSLCGACDCRYYRGPGDCIKSIAVFPSPDGPVSSQVLVSASKMSLHEGAAAFQKRSPFGNVELRSLPPGNETSRIVIVLCVRAFRADTLRLPATLGRLNP